MHNNSFTSCLVCLPTPLLLLLLLLLLFRVSRMQTSVRFSSPAPASTHAGYACTCSRVPFFRSAAAPQAPRPCRAPVRACSLKPFSPSRCKTRRALTAHAFPRCAVASPSSSSRSEWRASNPKFAQVLALSCTCLLGACVFRSFYATDAGRQHFADRAPHASNPITPSSPFQAPTCAMVVVRRAHVDPLLRPGGAFCSLSS